MSGKDGQREKENLEGKCDDYGCVSPNSIENKKLYKNEANVKQNYERMPEEEYLQAIRDLDRLMQDFCRGSDKYLIDSVQTNLVSLQDIIIRVHKRKHYFKIFHNDMRPSEYKETALYCYWVLKLRPFWVDSNQADAERINENFALYLYISLLKRYNKSFSERDGVNEKHITELLYSFRFRDITKESMILMLEPYYYECFKENDVVR